MDANAVEQGVDGARAAATRVEEARKKATEAKDFSLRLINIQDEWTRYKATRMILKRTAEIEQEASRAYEEVSEHRHAVMKATNAYPQNGLGVISHRAAESAYHKACADIKIVGQLVDEVRQNCKDAFHWVAKDG